MKLGVSDHCSTHGHVSVSGFSLLHHIPTTLGILQLQTLALKVAYVLF